MKKQTTFDAPIMTGKTSVNPTNTQKAVRQIVDDFKKVRQFKVGCKKPDGRSGELDDKTYVPGVTALSVSELLPMQ